MLRAVSWAKRVKVKVKRGAGGPCRGTPRGEQHRRGFVRVRVLRGLVRRRHHGPHTRRIGLRVFSPGEVYVHVRCASMYM
jgi:hypothetical protein